MRFDAELLVEQQLIMAQRPKESLVGDSLQVGRQFRVKIDGDVGLLALLLKIRARHDGQT